MPDFAESPARNSLLSRPISVYSIPPELLDILTVRSIRSTPADRLQHGDATAGNADDQNRKGQTSESTAKDQEASAGSSLTCQTCLNTSFATLEEQRAHFKSDWHRYNAKVSMQNKGGRGVLTPEEFEEIDDGKLQS